MELQSEVKLDFSGAQALANYMGQAKTHTASLRRDVTEISRGLKDAQRQLVMSRVPDLPKRNTGPASVAANRTAADKDPYGGFKLAAAGAAGSAFFMKSAGMANPSAMHRFEDAIADTTAVIGHRLIPALEQFTKLVRGAGDWLANHPTTTKAIGYGVTGLAAAGAIGIGLAGARTAYGGVKWGVQGIGRQFGYGVAATETAALLTAGNVGAAGAGTAAATGQRAAQTAAYANSLKAERAAASRVKMLTAAELASGGLGAGAANARALEEAKKELQVIRAEQQLARVPPLPNRNVPPPVPKKGTLGKLGGKGGLILGTVIGAFEVGDVAADELREARRGVTPEGQKPEFKQDWLDRQLTTATRGADFLTRGQTSWALRQMGIAKTKEDFDKEHADPKSSWGAAARGAQYQDIVGSVYALRQSIAEGAGLDPAKETAENTGKMVGYLADIAAKSVRDAGSAAAAATANPSTDRGTGGT